MNEIDLKIDESMLTGESLRVDKDPTPIQEENLSPGDQLNMAFMGTIVVSGRGRGIVVATGGQTSLGGIADWLAMGPRATCAVRYTLVDVTFL